MGLNGFTFGGINSAEHGVFISGGATFAAPERDYEVISIAGRNGDLIIENDRWKNIEVSYPAFIIHGINNNLPALRAALSAKKGYQRLEDSYHPDEFRMGHFVGGFHPNMGAANRYATFEVRFDCKPQRFLKSGEQVQTITATSKAVNNPTLFEARPLLKVTTSGGGLAQIWVNHVEMRVQNAPEEFYMDFELQDVYTPTENLGARATRNYPYPPLVSGENTIARGSTVTKIELTPRWWTL